MDIPVTAFLKKETAPQPWQAIAQRFGSIGINEIYVNNGNTAINDGMSYVEIRNNGEFPYEYVCLYLSDDENNLKKLRIESRVIEPNEVSLISIDDDIISLSREGGDWIILSDESGNIIEKLFIKEMVKNHAYALDVDTNKWENMRPSPGLNNYGLEKPFFSEGSGFYDTEFEVSIEAEKDTTIYYTVDGSVPTKESEIYKNPIRVYDRSKEPNYYRTLRNVTYDYNADYINWDEEPVDKAFVLRAVAVGEEGKISEVATATYFVNQEKYEGRSVVSINVNPEDFWGNEGIYSTGEAYDNWYLNGQEGEAPQTNFDIHGLECLANIELFSGESDVILNQECGLRVQGHSARLGRRKRLSVFSREEYSGSEFFENIIFEGKQTHSVVLRDGLDNALCMELVNDRDVATQGNIPVTFFLNGEWWCDTYLQEKYSDEYFEVTYGIENAEYYKYGITEEIQSYLQNNDLEIQENYLEFGEMIDIQSYIDYTCSNVYMANADYNEHVTGANVAIWKSVYEENESYGDGKWRWALYDLDLETGTCRHEWGLQDSRDDEVNSFAMVRPWATPVNQRPIFSNLKKNEEFRKQFVLSFMDMVNTNFSVEEVEKKLQKYGLDISYKDYFYANRAENITKYLSEEFGLSGRKELVTLNTNMVDAGEIIVNTCTPNMSDGSWAGEYFIDYPITISVVPREGYVFLGWEGDIETMDTSIEVNLEKGGVWLNAIFKKVE